VLRSRSRSRTLVALRLRIEVASDNSLLVVSSNFPKSICISLSYSFDLDFDLLENCKRARGAAGYTAWFKFTALELLLELEDVICAAVVEATLKLSTETGRATCV